MRAMYHENPGCFVYKTIVVGQGVDDAGKYLVFEQTNFYPQGGGQPFDRGVIEVDENVISIVGVKIKDNEIRHYIGNECERVVGKEAFLSVDSLRRNLHSKLHTAGHLINHAVENVYPGCRAVKGHHFPGECYVEFPVNVPEMNLAIIQAEIDRLIQEDLSVDSDYVEGSKLSEVCPNLSYKVPANEEIRLIRIGNYDFQPCCGTHVKSLADLSGLKLTKQKQKGSTVKISYEMMH